MCFSAQAPCTWYAIFPDVLHSGAGKPRTLGAAAEDAIQAPGDDLSPSAASGLQDLHPQPLRSSPRDAVIVEKLIVRHVRATLAEGKVHTHCFPGASVLNVSAQIHTILKEDESFGSVVLHAGVNDTKLRQTETLKRDFRSLIETVCFKRMVVSIRNCSLLIIFSGSVLGFSMLMACTPAESGRNSCRTTSPGRYALSD